MFLEKGYAGELQFDAMISGLQNENLILNDLLLESNNTLFQIDSLIIFEKTIYLCNVKNYEGDYCYKSDGFFTVSGTPLKDPLLQLKKSESLLRQLLHKYGYNPTIEAYLVYVNTEFTLYQPTVNHQIILPSQVKRFIKKLSMIPSTKLNKDHTNIAEVLLSEYKVDNPYTRLPHFQYDQIRKGITCSSCDSFSISVVGREQLDCKVCGCKDSIESAVLRCVEEINLLFPDMNITTKIVQEWCKVIKSRKMIRRILKKNLKTIGNTKECYYEKI